MQTFASHEENMKILRIGINDSKQCSFKNYAYRRLLHADMLLYKTNPTASIVLFNIKQITNSPISQRVFL